MRISLRNFEPHICLLPMVIDYLKLPTLLFSYWIVVIKVLLEIALSWLIYASVIMLMLLFWLKPGSTILHMTAFYPCSTVLRLLHEWTEIATLVVVLLFLIQLLQDVTSIHCHCPLDVTSAAIVLIMTNGHTYLLVLFLYPPTGSAFKVPNDSVAESIKFITDQVAGLA